MATLALTIHVCLGILQSQSFVVVRDKTVHTLRDVVRDSVGAETAGVHPTVFELQYLTAVVLTCRRDAREVEPHETRLAGDEGTSRSEGSLQESRSGNHCFRQIRTQRTDLEQNPCSPNGTASKQRMT